MRRACVTGGAGFIGSNLVDHLLGAGIEVVAVDDLRSGHASFLAHLEGRSDFTFVQADVFDADRLQTAFDGCDWIFHLQANADVRYGTEHPELDLEQNTVATSRVLEAMRAVGVRNVLFTSTGSVYGEPEVFPTPEDVAFPVQTSFYAASKLAGEGLVESYASGYGFNGVICRLVSVLGERYTHGHVFDFYRALRADPTRLAVLGNGKQEKSYLYVGDCVAAMALLAERRDREQGVGIFNLGTEETVVVDDSIAIICDHLGLSPEIVYSGGARGWIGDSPLIRLDTARIRSLGWSPTRSIREAIVVTLEWFDAHPEHFVTSGER